MSRLVYGVVRWNGPAYGVGESILHNKVKFDKYEARSVTRGQSAQPSRHDNHFRMSDLPFDRLDYDLPKLRHLELRCMRGVKLETMRLIFKPTLPTSVIGKAFVDLINSHERSNMQYFHLGTLPLMPVHVDTLNTISTLRAAGRRAGVEIDSGACNDGQDEYDEFSELDSDAMSDIEFFLSGFGGD
ncbi:hypothetical protein ACM66B_005581 [Microbotryomycetes sp. NB124-2]